MAKNIKTALKKLVATIAVMTVRLIPFILLASTLLWYLETLHSYLTGNYNEVQDINGNILSISYDTPIMYSLRNILDVSFISLIPLLIVSNRMSFCVYHRTPIYYQFLNLILISYFSSRLTVENTYLFCILSFLLIGFIIILSTYLYLKYGDRRIQKT